MKKMVCEVCGSTDIVKQDGMFVCEGCGIKYNLDEAKKLFEEVDSNKPEEDETDKLFSLARRALEDMNVKNGEMYYGMLMLKVPDNWEVNFSIRIFKAKIAPM